MDWTDCPYIEIDSEKLSGVPLLKGTRVQADTIIESAELGESPAEIAYNFDLDVEDVCKLVAYADSYNAVSAS